MPRKQLIRTNLFPYHVTTRTNNKEWFEIPIKEVWKMCLYSLKRANQKYPVEVISFVLMSNHYHLILKTPNKDIDLFMYEFNKSLSLLIRTRTGRINSVFGGRYKWCLIRSQTYLYNCYRYVYQNPLRANLCGRVENYPYSSLFYLVHGKSFVVQLFDCFGFKDKFALSWLNQAVENEEIDLLRKGLKTSEFKELKSRTTRKPLTHLSYHKSPGTFKRSPSNIRAT